jgi:ketosteroid isomerase-like protein
MGGQNGEVKDCCAAATGVAAAILRTMPDGNADLIRGVYGFNWAAVDDRGRGLAAAREVMASDVQARVSPEVGDRTLHGVEGFAVFVEGLEEDFSEFRYEAEEYEELSAGQLLVTGHIRARGRRSNMPLSAPFGHLWTVRDGKAVKVEARMTPGAQNTPPGEGAEQ